MNLNDLYDVHCHRAKDGVRSIVSQYQHFDQDMGSPYRSMGAHPWYLTSVDWNQLRVQLQNENVVAIGECGLDKATVTDWSLQLEAFRKQVEWANEIKKPLVIHCVRAWSELIAELKGIQVPVVIHGFSKGRELAEQLLKEGFYLSVGMAVMKDSMVEVLKSVPMNRLLCETDDAELSVVEVYKRISEVLQIDANELVLSIKQNVLSVFEID